MTRSRVASRTTTIRAGRPRAFQVARTRWPAAASWATCLAAAAAARACRSASAARAAAALCGALPCPVASELRGGDGAERVGGAGAAAAAERRRRPAQDDHERSDDPPRAQCTVLMHLGASPDPVTRSSDDGRCAGVTGQMTDRIGEERYAVNRRAAGARIRR